MVSSVTELIAQVQSQEQSQVFPPFIESAVSVSISMILFSIFSFSLLNTVRIFLHFQKPVKIKKEG